MKLENITVGMTVKNYKAMCELLGEKVKTGKAKQLQLKDWERFFKHHKEGNKFVIDEVFTQAKKKQANKRNNVYGEMTQLLIIDSLLGAKDNHISVPKKYLLEDLGIVNPNYGGLKEDVKKLSEWLKMDIRYIWEFYSINDSNFTSIINKALKALEDERLITVEKVVKVKRANEYDHQHATPEEIELIMYSEKEVLDKLGYNKISEVRVSKDWKKFKDMSTKLVQEESDIQYYYMAYDIYMNRRHLERAKERLIDHINSYEDRVEMLDNMNGVVRKNIVNNAKRRQDNEFKKPTKYFDIRTDGKYIQNTEKLSGLLVQRGTKDITNDVLHKKKQTVSQ